LAPASAAIDHELAVLAAEQPGTGLDSVDRRVVERLGGTGREPEARQRNDDQSAMSWTRILTVPD